MEFFRISPRCYSSQFSQVIVLFHFSRKRQNKKFLEFFQLFAAFIEMEKCRLACLIDSCQEKAQNSYQCCCSFNIRDLQIRLRQRLRVRVFQCVPGAHARLREAVTPTRSVFKISSSSLRELRDFQRIWSPDYEFSASAKASEKVSLQRR